MTRLVANLSLAPVPRSLAFGAVRSDGQPVVLRDLSQEAAEEVRGLLTFRIPPIREELVARAERLADLIAATGASDARLDVPGCLRAPLEAALRRPGRDITPLYESGLEGTLVEGGTGGATNPVLDTASRMMDHRIFNLAGRPATAAEVDEGVVDVPRSLALHTKDILSSRRHIGSSRDAALHARNVATYVRDTLRAEERAKPPFKVMMDGHPALTTALEREFAKLDIAVVHPIKVAVPDALKRHEALAPSVACGEAERVALAQGEERPGRSFMDRIRDLTAKTGLGHRAPTLSSETRAAGPIV